MERLPALTSAVGIRFRNHDQNHAASSSLSEAVRGPANEEALEELEELGLYLAHQHRLEREDMRRRGRRAKWTESKRLRNPEA